MPVPVTVGVEAQGGCRLTVGCSRGTHTHTHKAAVLLPLPCVGHEERRPTTHCCCCGNRHHSRSARWRFGSRRVFREIWRCFVTVAFARWLLSLRPLYALQRTACRACVCVRALGLRGEKRGPCVITGRFLWSKLYTGNCFLV